MANSSQGIDDVVAVHGYGARDAEQEVEVKLDNDATSFSVQNAFFFATLCRLAYGTREEAKSALQSYAFWGSGVVAGDTFEWFEADDEVASASSFDAIHDTEGFIAVNDEAIVVVFRGSKEGSDWFTNLSVLPRDIPTNWKLKIDGGVLHRGFDDGVNTMWLPGPGHPEGMHSVITKFYHEEGKRRKLYIAGHSLGGALATIVASRLVFVDNLNIAGMYTMGSPRVFNAAVADVFNATVNHGIALKNKYFRCRNNNDIVPRVPPSPYEHVGTEVYFDRFGALSTTSLMDRLLGRWSALLRFSFIDGINDHSGSEYIRLFKQSVIASKISLLGKATSVATGALQKVAAPCTG